MSMFDKLKDVVSEHGDQAKNAVEKAGDLLDAKTGGKYAKIVDTAQEKASDFVDDLKKDAPEAPEETDAAPSATA